MVTSSPAIFFEEQRFRQKWIWIPLLTIGILSVAVTGWGLYQQLALGKPWGNHPTSDGLFIGIFFGIVFLWAGMVWFFWATNLITRIDSNGLSVRFFPFQCRPQRIHRNDIQLIEVKTYSMTGKYRGYGYGIRPGGRVYNISGHEGVLLTFTDDRFLLVGSQKAQDLAAAIGKL